MRFNGFPLRSLVILILTLSCPILALAAPVSRETIERLAEMNVERGEIRHLNLIGKLTDQEYSARMKPLDTEGATLWELIPREERNAAQSAITGLSRAKLSLKEPGWRKEEDAYREAQSNLRAEAMRDADRSAKEAAQIQKQRQSLQAQLDKGTLDQTTFNQKDAEALAAITALRNKNDPTGRGRPGYYFDERLTYYTSRMNEPPKPPAPRPVAKPPVVIYQPPPPPPDFTFIYAIGGGAVFIGLLWLLSRGQKEEAPAAPPVTDIHGSAMWHPLELQADPHTVSRGLHFGKSCSPEYKNKPFSIPTAPVTSRPEFHSLIVARTRAGKGTRVIIPTLIRYWDSMLIIDPKGENAAITARARRDQMGHAVHIVNPWGELKDRYSLLGFTTATFNPLDAIDRNDPNAVAIAQHLAATISPVTDQKERFWQGGAANILAAVMLWLADQPGEKKTLARTRELVTKSREDFRKDLLAPMMSSKAFGGAIKEMVSQYYDLAPETYSGIIANLSEATKFLSDPQIKATTDSSSFSMNELRDARITVYLVIPHDRIKTHSTWLRLVISSAMFALKSRNKIAKPPHFRCMFMIDEFGSIGNIPGLPEDIAIMAGYGLDFTLIVQGIDQLKHHYGEAAKTILNNCAYKWFCYVADLDTAKYLSEAIGKKTVATVSKSKSQGTSGEHPTAGESTSYSETGRSLLNPDEVLTLGRDIAILLHPYGASHYLATVDYWNLQKAYASFEGTHPQFYWWPPIMYDANPYRNDDPPSPPPTHMIPTAPAAITPEARKAGAWTRTAKPADKENNDKWKAEMEKYFGAGYMLLPLRPPAPPHINEEGGLGEVVFEGRPLTPEEIAKKTNAPKKPQPGDFDYDDPEDKPSPAKPPK